MAHFARCALLAFEKLAVDDDTAAYARADGNVDRYSSPK
jgi:hypothetical protein